jgi:hypothetical protein
MIKTTAAMANNVHITGFLREGPASLSENGNAVNWADFLSLYRMEDDLAEKGAKPLPAAGDYRTAEMVAVVNAGIAA